MTDLVRRAPDGNSALARGDQFTPEQIDLLKRTTADGKLDNDQFSLFLARAKATGLDPFTNQISAQARWDKRANRHNMSIVTGIDGFRLIADRTGERDGEAPPLWCAKDGKWIELWTSDAEPYAARVVVYRKGCSQPFYGIAKLKAYKPVAGLWSGSWWVKAPDHMLAKCAEALALRKAFPAELSGMYTRDEMDQAKAPPERKPPPPASRPQYEPPPSSASTPYAEDEPMPTTTAQRIEVAAVIKSLGRKRTIAGLDTWVEDNGDELKQLSDGERAEVIKAYRARRALVHEQVKAQETSAAAPIDDDRAERAAVEAEANEAEAYFDKAVGATEDELGRVF